MSTTRAYRAGRRTARSEQTRERITDAVRELLADGSFHQSSVEEVAERAGISRATLYQHFRSRLDLVDAICDTFDLNPALLRLRETVVLDDADAALEQTIALAMRFWSSEDSILSQLYGVAAIDPAAHDLVERQRADRRSEMTRLVANLRDAGRLRKELSNRRALAVLMLLTSYETFNELRLAGLSERKLVETLHDSARTLLLK
jgi:AcrR family transcriptional regulator